MEKFPGAGKTSHGVALYCRKVGDGRVERFGAEVVGVGNHVGVEGPRHGLDGALTRISLA
jgi:hypothetical protein